MIRLKSRISTDRFKYGLDFSYKLLIKIINTFDLLGTDEAYISFPTLFTELFFGRVVGRIIY